MEATLQPALTESKKQLALDDLNTGGEALLNELRGLTEDQWRFKPSPDVWSIAENVEHITIIEGIVCSRLPFMHEGDPAEPGRNDDEIDEFVRRAIPLRGTKAQAPPAAVPSGTWTLDIGIDKFSSARRHTVAMLDEPLCFRGKTRTHPILGPWDGYQWMLAIAAHGLRHTNQIREIKGDEGFPRP